MIDNDTKLIDNMTDIEKETIACVLDWMVEYVESKNDNRFDGFADVNIYTLAIMMIAFYQAFDEFLSKDENKSQAELVS